MTRSHSYQTLPTLVLTQAEQGDRWLHATELKALSDFFASGAKRLEVAAVLSREAETIVAAAADRIFCNGSAMAYLERLPNRDHLPGYTPFPRRATAPAKEALKLQLPSNGNPLRRVREFLQTQLSGDRDPLPGGFRLINIQRYGEVRMKRSMRDLSWFLRYVTYAIAAGDCSILTANVRGLRGVIPEDVTEATVVALQEMRWRSLRYFQGDATATALIREAFDITIAAYRVEKLPARLRQGFAAEQQGLQLPGSYATRPQLRFVMKPGLSETEQQRVIRAAYRQVFERDITREYGSAIAELESRFRSGEYSTKEFVRQLGHSRLYRDQFYAPFVISRTIELAVRHFLGRGLCSLAEFQRYFDVISAGGLTQLVDAIVDSPEYSDYFGEETVPYLRGLGQEAQQCRSWSTQQSLFKFSAIAQKVPQFVRLGEPHKPLPNQHPYGAGNDPLEIPFSAIFPRYAIDEHPAAYSKDDRRMLIHCTSEEPNAWGKVPGAESQSLHFAAHPSKHPNSSLDLLHHSPDAVIQAVYRQVLGRETLADQHLTAAEVKLKSGETTVREFVRQLAKSPLFRSLHWDNLYVTKAIESIHRRLLGRPTSGREELSRYYGICAGQGFYALVDELIDSLEYSASFSEDTVPYERSVTPRSYSLRSRHQPKGSNSPEHGERVADGTWMRAAMQRVSPVQSNGRVESNAAPLNGYSLPELQTTIAEILQPENAADSDRTTEEVTV